MYVRLTAVVEAALAQVGDAGVDDVGERGTGAASVPGWSQLVCTLFAAGCAGLLGAVCAGSTYS